MNFVSGSAWPEVLVEERRDVGAERAQDVARVRRTDGVRDQFRRDREEPLEPRDQRLVVDEAVVQAVRQVQVALPA